LGHKRAPRGGPSEYERMDMTVSEKVLVDLY
jgi:hypothetical protein